MDALFYKNTMYGGGGVMRGNYFNPIIYSTEEREVGVWKNNKPLYQKTIIIDNVPSGSGTFDIYTLDSDIENVVNHISFMNSGAYTRFVPYVDVGNYDMNIYFNLPTIKLVVDNDSWAGYTLYITIQYTKTTDVAGSGAYTTLGVPAVHYTTDEQVIGTWIDGTPVYKKVVALASPTDISYNNWQDMGVSITGGDKVLSCFGVATDGTNSPLHAYFETGGVVTCQTPRNNSVSYNIEYLIIEYTKTTD